MTFRVLPPIMLAVEDAEPGRCRHERVVVEHRCSEAKGGGPRVLCEVRVCTECDASWITRKTR